MFMIHYLIDFLGTLRVFFKAFVEGMCILPHGSVVITISGTTFHPLLLICLIDPSYFVVF